MQLGLVFGCKTNNQPYYGLTSYANNNFTKDSEDCKLMIGYCFFLNGIIILWSSKKQQIISLSIAKAKDIVLGHVAREVV